MRRTFKAVACPLLISLFLAACDSKPLQEISYDHFADVLHLAAPTLDFIPPAATDRLPEAAQRRLRWQRMFFQREFATLDAELLASHRAFMAKQEDSIATQILASSLGETKLAGIDVCRDWLAQMPASYSAHVVCASLWHKGAWDVRSHDYASKVSAINFKLMAERFVRADALLEQAIELDPQPVEALEDRGSVQFMLGDAETADDLWQKAQQLAPDYLDTYFSRMNYALPEWGGSVEEMEAIYADAKAAGFSEGWLANLRDQMDLRGSLELSAQDRVAYLQKALAERKTNQRLNKMMYAQASLKNYESAIQFASLVVEAEPDSSHAYYQRAEYEKTLGMAPQALADYKMAAALGHNYAMWAVINAYKDGNLGMSAKSWDDMLVYCREGAVLGLPSGAHCMARVLDETVPEIAVLPKNMPQALAWYQLAARGGHRSSQCYLGLHMLAGKVPGLTPEQSKTIGTFWLRRAAKQDVPLASQKLQELGVPVEEEVEDHRLWRQQWPIWRKVLFGI